MSNRILYKYLDAEGGIQMLKNSNLQFTNATRLNDPFDCHPSLIDFSIVPPEKTRVWDKNAVMGIESNRSDRLRDGAWICSLSKVHNSILMWSYYGNHKGVCIGIDMEKAQTYLSKVICKIMIGAIEWDVKYRVIIDKPDYFHDSLDYLKYQVATKAKAWEHEQEVRLVLFDPSPGITPYRLRYKSDKEEITDWREVRFYPIIGKECFDSIYLGINIEEKKKEDVVRAAKNLNPEIRIFQMGPDPDAFRIRETLI